MRSGLVRLESFDADLVEMHAFAEIDVKHGNESLRCVESAAHRMLASG